MNFIIAVPGKLHCILGTVTNFQGPSQVTGPGRKISLRKFMIMGQFGQTIPRISRIRHHKCLEHFELFLPRTWTSQSFLLMYQKSFNVFLLRGKL